MKQKLVFEDTLLGSTAEWPVRLLISKNERSGLFTLYVHFTDPEARQYSAHRFRDEKELLDLIEEAYLDPKEVAQTLTKHEDECLAQLGRLLVELVPDEESGA